jgi:hypothetical protein
MSLRQLIFWEHERGTWQYDIFCLLIIAFIFLTPKAWFNKGEPLATRTAGFAVETLDLSKVSTVAEYYSTRKSDSPGISSIDRPQ